MTIREFIINGLLVNANERLEKLTEMSAPQIIIDGQEKYIENLKNGSIKIGGDADTLDELYISHDIRTGRGGKKYLNINNSINFFPNAQYGMYIKRATK